MWDICKAAGGFIYPLGILAFLGGLFFVERIIFFRKKYIYPKDFLNGIENLIKKSRLLEALTICEGTPGSVACLMKVALIHYQKPVEILQRILQQSALLELPILQKRVESLRMMGQIAPIIGLIGTVFYLLKGFWALSALQAYTYLNSFSPYIVSAISVTLLGLIEMLLFTMAYHFLMGRIRMLVFDMEWAVSEILLFLQREKSQKGVKLEDIGYKDEIV